MIITNIAEVYIMKYKILLSLLTIVSFSQAIELRIGSGSFGWDMQMPFVDADFSLDTNVYSISENHNNFGQSNFYYFYNADIFQSDFMDKMTTFVTQPLTYNFPLFGSFNDAAAKYTSIPLPADYKIRGFDLNFGIGYDILHNEKAIFGAGINTGISLPVMKMENLQKSAKLTYDLLDKTETSISTYKLGMILHASYQFTSAITVFGSYGMGFQTGSIENDWVKSSFDADGSYTTFDCNLRFTPWQTTKDLGWIRLDPKLFFTLGYSHKSWSMNNVKINTFNIAQFDSGGLFALDFDSSSFYLGAGYDF